MSEEQNGSKAGTPSTERLGSAGWAISLNGETYDGDVFKDESDAIEEGTVGYNGVPFWLGKVCPLVS